MDITISIKGQILGGPDRCYLGTLEKIEDVDPSDACRQAKRRSKRIIEKYTTLKNILERHEAAIRKRWVKKTRSQRLNILLKVWPSMPAPHRPDYYSIYNRYIKHGKNIKKFRKELLCPFLNQEDLLPTKSLPLLLNARGRSPPSVFSTFDHAAITDAIITATLPECAESDHLMLLHDSSSAEKYGLVVPNTSNEAAMASVSFGLGEGLYVLEAQDRLYNFLTESCQEVLHDISIDALASNAFPVLPEPAMDLENDALELKALDSMVLELQYGDPSRFDMTHIENILSAKATVAEDHLLALREDPSYFQEEISEARDHCKEMLQDVDGAAHPVIQARKDTILWARVVKYMLRDAYLRLDIFNDLRQQAKDLRGIQKKYAGSISDTSPLPQEYVDALLYFRYYLGKSAKCFNHLMELAASSSPPLRRYYSRCPRVKWRAYYTKKPYFIMIDRKECTSKDQRRLLGILSLMWEDDYPESWSALPFIVDAISYMIQSQPVLRSMISTYTESMFDDVAIIAQCIKQMALFQPWATELRKEFTKRKPELKARYKQTFESRVRVLDALKSRDLRHAGELARPTPGKFAYPINRRHGRENVQILRRSESNLDKFWDEIDKHMKEVGIHADGTPAQCLLANYRELRRTPEWVERKSTKKSKPCDGASQPVMSFSGPFDTRDPQNAIGSPKPKVKVKTKGKLTEAQPRLKDESENLEAQQQENEAIIPVDNRALKVFGAILGSPDLKKRPGEVQWNDFLHAMVSAGFKAEKLFGSVWQFSPMKLDVGRSIHFHEPHPKGRMAIQVARRFGGRLNRAYGWTGEMFVLKDKAKRLA